MDIRFPISGVALAGVRILAFSQNHAFECQFQQLCEWQKHGGTKILFISGRMFDSSQGMICASTYAIICVHFQILTGVELYNTG